MIQTQFYQQYEAFQGKRQALVALIRELREVLHTLDMSKEKTLQELETLVQSETFKVLVLGEFKRGKSTFINAMLRDEILPAYAKPCTAIINEVKWGETPRALLHYSKSENGIQPQPQEIPIKQIADYVVIKDDVSELHGNPYDKVELFWPLLLCQNGVEIIDSPGLNEHDIRQKVTIDYLSKVDAILFILSCEALASKSEMDVIDNILRPTGHEDIFFICNRFNMIRAKEKEDVRQYGISKLASRTKQGAERVFFISALDALEGYIENDADRVAKSGMLQVEQELEKFLVNERGRIKILRSAREVQKAIYAARQIIPERSSMLRTDSKTLEDRYENAKEPLRRLEMERDQIIRRISNFRDDIKLTISAEACGFYRSLPNKVNEWMKTLDTKNSINFISFESTKAQAERLIQEIASQLSSKVEGEFILWQSNTLQPLLTKQLEPLIQELDERANAFVEKIDELRLQVSGSAVSISDIGPKKIGAIERILSAAGGFFIGAFGSAGLGAVFGYQEMVKNIVPQLGLAVIALMVGITNPLIFLAVMTSGGFIQGLWTAKSTNDKVKEEVGKRFAASIQDSAQQRGNEVAEAAIAELRKIQDGVNQGLSREIQNVRDQVNSILREKHKGQGNVEQKLRELESLRKKIDVIDQQLDDLIADVAMSN